MEKKKNIDFKLKTSKNSHIYDIFWSFFFISDKNTTQRNINVWDLSMHKIILAWNKLVWRKSLKYFGHSYRNAHNSPALKHIVNGKAELDLIVKCYTVVSGSLNILLHVPELMRFRLFFIFWWFLLVIWNKIPHNIVKKINVKWH